MKSASLRLAVLKKRVLFTTLAAGLLLLVTEITARFFLGLGSPPLSIADPAIEYMSKPNQDIWRFGSHIQVNRFGMRSDDFSAARTDTSELRVLVFGDSVLNGGSLTTQNDLATEHIRKKLIANAGQPTVVGNISAGSWGPPNQLAYAEKFGFFDADAVVIVLSSHDADDTPTFAPLNSKTHPQHSPWLAVQEGFTRYAWPRIKKAVFRRSAGTPKPVEAFERQGVKRYGVSALNALAELIELSRPRPTLVFHYPDRDETRSGVFNAVASDIEQTVNGAGATYIPLLGTAAPSLSFYRDQIHPNAAGQAWLADQIWPPLRRALGDADKNEQ